MTIKDEIRERFETEIAQIICPLVCSIQGTKIQIETFRYLSHIYNSDDADAYFIHLIKDEYERKELRKDIRRLKEMVNKIERKTSYDPDYWNAAESIYTSTLKNYILKFSELLAYAEYFHMVEQKDELAIE